MKLIGFIKEHNDIKEAQQYIDILDDIPINQETVVKIIDYLKKGVLVLAWMGYFVALDDGGLICPDCYYTDGYYIWPAYFPYYLNKHPNYLMDKEFLKHLSESNLRKGVSKIPDERKNEIEDHLSKKLNGDI